jgi:hypothetical protein
MARGKGFDVEFNTKDFQKLLGLSNKGSMHRAIRRATPFALNKARRQSQTKAARMSVGKAGGINLPVNVVKKDFKQFRPANKEKLSTGWNVRNKARNAASSKSTAQLKRKGLRYKPWKGGAYKYLQNGFLAKSGKTAFARVGKSRLPIRAVFMPSTATWLQQRGRWGRLQRFATKIVDKEIIRLTQLQWNKMFGRAGLKNKKAG